MGHSITIFFQKFLESPQFTFMNWIKIQFQADSQHPPIIGTMLVTSACILMTIHHLHIVTKPVITTKMKTEELMPVAQKQSELRHWIQIDSRIASSMYRSVLSLLSKQSHFIALIKELILNRRYSDHLLGGASHNCSLHYILTVVSIKCTIILNWIYLRYFKRPH